MTRLHRQDLHLSRFITTPYSSAISLMDYFLVLFDSISRIFFAEYAFLTYPSLSKGLGTWALIMRMIRIIGQITRISSQNDKSVATVVHFCICLVSLRILPWIYIII